MPWGNYAPKGACDDCTRMGRRLEPLSTRAGPTGSPPPLPMDATPETDPKRAELKAFLFLTVVMAPALAGIIIATYGLAVWIYQMFAGPPTA